MGQLKKFFLTNNTSKTGRMMKFLSFALFIFLAFGTKDIHDGWKEADDALRYAVDQKDESAVSKLLLDFQQKYDKSFMEYQVLQNIKKWPEFGLSLNRVNESIVEIFLHSTSAYEQLREYILENHIFIDALFGGSHKIIETLLDLFRASLQKDKL